MGRKFLIIIFFILAIFSCDTRTSKIRSLALKLDDINTYSKDELNRYEKNLSKEFAKVDRAIEDTLKNYRAKGYYSIGLGYTFFTKGMYKLAVEYFTVGLENLSDMERTEKLYYFTATSYASYAKELSDKDAKIKNFNSAIDYYKKASSANPNFSNGYYGIAVIEYFEFGNVDVALQNVMKAVNIEKTNINAHYLLAKLYVEVGDMEKAVNQYSFIIDNFPKEVTISAAENKKILLDGNYGR